MVPQISPDQVLPLCSAYVISKNHLSSPHSSRGEGLHRTFFSCLLLYVGLPIFKLAITPVSDLRIPPQMGIKEYLTKQVIKFARYYK